jgi:hypothetical protein
MVGKRSDQADGQRVIAPERLTRLLDSYGAASERWPREERDAVRRRIARSSSAKRLWEEASYLDHLLDALEPDVPEAVLVGRVLAASPARRPRRVARRAMLAAVVLAAVAAVLFWLAPSKLPLPAALEAMKVPIGVYTTATDVLLQPNGVEPTVPSIGCAESMLGCPDVKGTGGPSSRRLHDRITG